jgi:ATP-binding cassette subfamily C protein CydC
VLSPAPIVLLDEPTEHLDAADGQRIVSALLDGRLLGPRRTVVVASHQLGIDLACPRLSIGDGR